MKKGRSQGKIFGGMWTNGTPSFYLSLLRENWSALSLKETSVLLINAIYSTLSEAPFVLYKKIAFARRVKKIVIKKPIFIIGHWRTGTTFLHELLVLDERHSFPNQFHCTVPRTFLISENWAPDKFVKYLPKVRPFDNVRVGWERPQEDEFALCKLGAPSLYRSFIIPSDLHKYQKYLDFEKLGTVTKKKWEKIFLNFIKEVVFANPGRLILKSPTHTLRIKTLLKLFPEAEFIHIMRDPFRVFRSTVHLYEKFTEEFSITSLNKEVLEDFIIENYRTLYQSLDEARLTIPEKQFYELKYEELVSDPIGQIEKIYNYFAWGDFDRVLPSLKNELEYSKNYQINKFQTDPDIINKLKNRLGPIIDQYGYSSPQKQK